MQKIGPKHRMCRRVGAAVCGRPNCASNKRPYPPGQHGRGRRRITEYHLRLLEKQKLRATYGVGERQFRRYFAEANRKKGVTGTELLGLLETAWTPWSSGSGSPRPCARPASSSRTGTSW